MYEFTGWNPKDKFSRNYVTRFMAQYVKDHNLQNPQSRSEIIPDLKLQKLLKYDPNNIPIGPIRTRKRDPATGEKIIIQGPLVLNYFRLQTLMCPHYIE
jgi:SWIB-domain-containing proteins implicated in chromatin remodeling